MPLPRQKNRIDLLQGTLDLLILEQLRWAPSHGYGLSQAIRVHSGTSCARMPVRCIRPSIAWNARACCAPNGRFPNGKQRTRVYRLTPRGRRHLAGERSKWEQLSVAIAGVLNRARPSET